MNEKLVAGLLIVAVILLSGIRVFESNRSAKESHLNPFEYTRRMLIDVLGSETQRRRLKAIRLGEAMRRVPVTLLRDWREHECHYFELATRGSTQETVLVVDNLNGLTTMQFSDRDR